MGDDELRIVSAPCCWTRPQCCSFHGMKHTCHEVATVIPTSNTVWGAHRAEHIS